MKRHTCDGLLQYDGHWISGLTVLLPDSPVWRFALCTCHSLANCERCKELVFSIFLLWRKYWCLVFAYCHVQDSVTCFQYPLRTQTCIQVAPLYHTLYRWRQHQFYVQVFRWLHHESDQRHVVYFLLKTGWGSLLRWDGITCCIGRFICRGSRRRCRSYSVCEMASRNRLYLRRSSDCLLASLCTVSRYSRSRTSPKLYS